MHCMIVLGLDTTTRTGSLAVMRDGLLLETAALPPGQPAASLPAEVGALIARHAIRIDQVSAFAVAVGPGSFTGLRIGVATMQGFAVAGRRPLIGVSGLDALALEEDEAGVELGPQRRVSPACDEQGYDLGITHQ